MRTFVKARGINMERVFGTCYENEPYAGPPLPDNTALLRASGIVAESSEEARRKAGEFAKRLTAGERLLLLGLNIGHNAGIALVEASRADGIVVHANFEEERFTAVKHFAGYPEHGVREAIALLERLGRTPRDLFCVVYAWDSVQEEQYGLQMSLLRQKIIKNRYYSHISSAATPQLERIKVPHAQRRNLYSHSPSLIDVMQRLNRQLDRVDPLLCIQACHHDNHAYYAYGVSPFFDGGSSGKTTMISCIDGGGDTTATSLYGAVASDLRLIKRYPRENSLGVFYMLCSSFLGGWAPLSSEGRYMGAAAWGNGDRLTNPYYMRLRQFFYFGSEGEVFVNTAMTRDEYRELQEIVGPFLRVEDLWNPDAVLNVDDIKHARVTRERVDKAAAVQMVFEDALFHILADLIARTGSDQLVLCGGTALNCVANMRLLQHFDRQYFQRYLGRDTQLHIWVPPIPSDQGVVVGAPFQFAMRNGAQPQRMLTPFLCGPAASAREIDDALRACDHVVTDRLGNINDLPTREAVADLMAYLVSRNAVIGIYQGEAETGPRALGNRSLLSNPCNPDTLAVLNDRVKLRERVRPLAPMVTRESAERWFELSPGASDCDYDAYNYMVLTAPARQEARKVIPAVIHHDGTSRIQIVRRENNPLMYDYLKALGRYIGVEVSVNTSLNVGSPIVQTPAQALEIFKRARGLDGLFMVAREGDVYVTWAKQGVQMHDSQLPQLCQAYWEARPATSFQEGFRHSLAASHSDPVPRLPAISAEPLFAHPQVLTIRSTGAGAPWIGVHGVTGDVSDDMPLLAALSRAHPVYGLRWNPEGTCGVSIPNLAKSYAQILHRSFPTGPYCLAGYSCGAVLAYEVARCLQEKVPGARLRLMLVDPPLRTAASTTANSPLRVAVESLLHHYLGAQGLHLQPLPSISEDQPVDTLVSELRSRGVPLPPTALARKLTRKASWCRELQVAFAGFHPTALPHASGVRLDLFRTYRLAEPSSSEVHPQLPTWVRAIDTVRSFSIPTDNEYHPLFSPLAQSALEDLLGAGPKGVSPAMAEAAASLYR